MSTTEILSSTQLSSNRVWGQLGATTAAEILDGCRRSRITGEVRFHSGGRDATVELRAGSIERVELDGATGDDALAHVSALADGTFEVEQRLPDLGGALGSAAEFHGDLAEIPLIQVMRHVEAHALTVTITIVREWDRATIEYRDGDIARVEVNGDTDEDRLGEPLAWTTGAFRVRASELELPVPSRRAPRRAPTEPFQIGHVAGLRRNARAPQPSVPEVVFEAEGSAPHAVPEFEVPAAPVAAPPREARAPRAATVAPLRGPRGQLRRLLGRARRVLDWLDARIA